MHIRILLPRFFRVIVLTVSARHGVTLEDRTVSPAEPLLHFPDDTAGGDQPLHEATRGARPIESPLKGYLPEIFSQRFVATVRSCHKSFFGFDPNFPRFINEGFLTFLANRYMYRMKPARRVLTRHIALRSCGHREASMGQAYSEHE